LLNAYKFKGWTVATVLQAQLNDFPNAFHQRVEILSLSVATPERRDSGDVVALFVALNQHSEFSWRFHKVILAWRGGRAASREEHSATGYGHRLAHFDQRVLLIFRQLSNVFRRAVPKSEMSAISSKLERIFTSGFGTIARFRQALDEVVHFSQYLGLVRLENIMTRALQSDNPGRVLPYTW
jgi:hypothetical protein